MKFLSVALLFGAIAMAAPIPQACGVEDVAFKVSKDKSRHAAPIPANGKATMVVFGWGKLAIDGKLVGAVNGTYSFADLDAGEHHLCGWWSGLMPLPVILVPIKLREISVHSLDAKTGETYYI